MKAISKFRHVDYRLFRLIEYLKTFGGPPITASNVVVNVGMPRSGSTVIHICIKKLLGIKGEVKYIDSPIDFKNLIDGDYFKTHTYFSEIAIKHHENNLKIVMTVRDIRDIAVSLIQKGWGKDLDDLLDKYVLDYIVNTALSYSDLRGLLILRYEDFNRDHLSLIEDVRCYLQVDITEEEVLSLLHQMNPDTTNYNVPSCDVYHKELGLHSNHIADGLSGKYKDFFTQKEQKKLRQRYKEFFIRFDYEC